MHFIYNCLVFFVLGVGINRHDTVTPISIPEVYVDQPIFVVAKLGFFTD